VLFSYSKQASRSDGSQPTPIHPTVKRLLGKTVRQSNQDSANKKPTHISSSDLSLSFRTGSSGSTSAVASRVNPSFFSSVVSTLCLQASNCNRDHYTCEMSKSRTETTNFVLKFIYSICLFQYSYP
jgi:hypothetical protein